MTLPQQPDQHNGFFQAIHADLNCLKAGDARLALEDTLRGLEREPLWTEAQRWRLQHELEAISALVDVLWREYVAPEAADQTPLADACWDALQAMAWAAQFTPETEALRQTTQALDRALRTQNGRA